MIQRDLARAREKAGAGSAGTRFWLTDKESGRKQYVGGLTDRLKRCFWPRHSFSRRRGRKLGLKGGSSAKWGTHVHAHVQHAINCADGECTCEKKPGGACPPLVRCLLSDLKTLHMTPIASECLVWSKDAGVMTPLDVLVRTESGTLAALELKTGNSGPIDGVALADNKFMSAPFNRKMLALAHNTVRHRHYMQALVGAYLFNMAYHARTKHTCTEAWVVYLNDVHRPDSHKTNQTKLSWYAAHDVAWARDADFMGQVHAKLKAKKIKK